jgi:S-adenosylmethionine:tRNA ribosyltransferase-isomerase
MTTSALAFDLPPDLEAPAPLPDRSAVRLLVARRNTIEHARFTDLSMHLSAGDLLVVNTSGTVPAAVEGQRITGPPVLVHFATALDDGDWVVEVRPATAADGPVPDLRTGEEIALPDGVELRVAEPHPPGQHRLWRAGVAVDAGVLAYLQRHGRPIRYGYVPRPHPIADYQTVFAREPGSAEMPSAGRPFTDQMVTDLVTAGVVIAPITLHTGVSSQDAGEPPQPERFAVPEATARLANMTRAWGGRVVAVGTTVTRALESAADERGVVRERRGWTDLVLGPDRPARVVRGLVTGWHAPGASHLELLQAVAGAELTARAYREALRSRYLWHEFGDSCLLLP